MIIRSLRQWWTRSNDVQLLAAQKKLLASLVQSPIVRAERSNQHGLNTVEFRPTANTTTPNTTQLLPTVILLHGFGSGLGFFFRNIDPLLQSGQVSRVILVDWLGSGGSDRPACRRPIRGFSDCTTAMCQSRFTPSQAVDFFIEPLHEWLSQETALKKEPLWMVGHSLGGYLLARYALKQQQVATEEANKRIQLQKVVLASPVGFPSKPTNLLPSAQLPTAMRLVDALWSANVTPQQLVRAMGATRGRNAVRRALAGRIPHLVGQAQQQLLQQSTNANNLNSSSSSVLDLLADYLFHITVAHPSGEFAMNSLLEPGMSPDVAGVFAREPLEPLFQDYAKHIHGAPKNVVPTWKVLFGDHDWMRPNEPSARNALEYLNNNSTLAKNATVSIVPNAGHHLYLDNPTNFVNHILN